MGNDMRRFEQAGLAGRIGPSEEIQSGRQGQFCLRDPAQVLHPQQFNPHPARPQTTSARSEPITQGIQGFTAASEPQRHHHVARALVFRIAHQTRRISVAQADHDFVTTKSTQRIEQVVHVEPDTQAVN